MKLEGIFPPLTTPFGSDGSVALDKLRSNIARYNRIGLPGYVVNGSTSESVLLRWDEVYRIWETAKEAAAPRKILIAGTGAESTAETIAHTERAAAIGFDCALVRTPSFYKPLMSIEVEATHYLRVADAARIPILVYSVPVFTNITVEAPLVARIAQHPNIIGIKDSSGSVARIAEIVAAAPERFQVLCGAAATFEESLEKGACGGVLAIANAFPELCCELFAAARAGDRARSKAIQEKMLEPGKLLGSMYGIPGLKYSLDKLGYYGGPPRLPLLPLNESAHREIDAMLATLAGAAGAGR